MKEHGRAGYFDMYAPDFPHLYFRDKTKYITAVLADGQRTKYRSISGGHLIKIRRKECRLLVKIQRKQ